MQGYNQATATYYFGPIDIPIDHLLPVRGSGKGETRLQYKEDFKNRVKDSIEKDGLKNPIDVIWYWNKQDIDKFVFGRGHNRVQACIELGWKSIPCYLRIYCYKNRGDDPNIAVNICEGLKTVLPLVRVSQSEDVTPAVGYDEWK